MKKLSKIILLLIFFSTLYSCQQLNENLSEVIIKLPLKKSIIIPDSLSGSNQIEVWHEDIININVDSIILANNLRKFNRVDISELSVSVPPSENGNNLGFIEKIRITISENNTFEKEVVIAEAFRFQPNDTEKYLDIITGDISSFIQHHERFYFRLYGKRHNSSIITHEKLRLNGKLQFFME
ncbi:MAG: hypothetical protein CSA94_00910 [Bacteroidetes bacterium]|nr:MAG: hypothetical protein CSA94_00910 [Bacteroidota bacterium]